MRARLALAISGVLYEHREVVLRNKPPELLAASPKGTVPVLVLPGGEVIDQSLDIMLWALQHNDPEGWLAPTRSSLEGMLPLIAINDGPFKKSLDRYKYPNRYADEHGGEVQRFTEANRSSGADWLMQLERLLAANGSAWLVGKDASLLDMALLPFARQYAHTDAPWFAKQAWPGVARWIADFEASALYRGVMDKHLPWRAAT